MNAITLPQYDFVSPTDRFAAVSIEEWRVLWRNIGAWKRAEQWFYGDLFNAGRRFVADSALRVPRSGAMLDPEWDQEVLRLIPHVGLDSKTLLNWAWVARGFPAKARFDKLSWSHHREVMGLPEGQRRKFLALAEKNEWAVPDLREAMAPEREDEDSGDVSPAGFVPRLYVQQGVRFLASLEPGDERVSALRSELLPLITQLKRLAMV